MTLTRDSFLAAPDLPIKDIPVPEMGAGATVRIRALTAAQRGEWEAYINAQDRKDMAAARASLAALSLVDDDGAPMFALADVPALGAKSGAVLDRIYLAAAHLSGLLKADVEKIEKNS